MAKQIVNPLERHVEKALLAVAGVALIGVVVMYAVTSPNKVEIDGQMVTPSDIDDKLVQKVSDVRQRLGSFRPEEKEPELLAEQFTEAREQFKAAQLASTFPAGPAIGPEVPFVDPKGAKAGQAQLVKVLKFDPPSVEHGRSTFIMQDGTYRPANWVTVAALIKLEDQSKVQALEYGSQRSEVIFGPPQIQRRAMHSDGTWSDEDWGDIEPWPATALPAPPRVVFEEEDGRQFVPRENRLAIERYQEDINFHQAQIEILRPLFPEIYNGDQWQIPDTVPCKEVLRMDDDYINRNVVEKTAESELEDRYGLCTVAPPAAAGPAQAGMAERFAEGERLLARAVQTNSEMDATLAFNIFVDISLEKSSSPQDKARAIRLYKDAEQRISDIRRQNRRGRGPIADVSGQEQQERQMHPTQLAWAHDALPGSVDSGKTYQYRMRATLFNRLAGEPSKFEDSEHAKVILASGEWSEPSEPVVVAPTTEFFVTNVDARKMVAKIEIYQWFEGYWVTTRESFRVGDQIAVTDRVQLPDEDDPTRIDKPEVSFDTGHTMLSILPDRLFREKKGRGGGVRFQDSLSREAAIVLTDSHGKVVERFVLTDKGSPTKKEASSRVWRPSRGGS